MNIATPSPNTAVDLTDLPAENLACLERIASLRGVSVAEVVAALIREDTDRLLATTTGRDHHGAPPTTRDIIRGASAAGRR